MANTFISASSSKFLITDSAGTQRDVSDYVTSIEGLPGKRDLVDLTCFGDTGHKWGPSLMNAEFTLNLLYNETATTGLSSIFHPMITCPSSATFYWYPNGTTNKLVTGSCWADDLNEKAQVGDFVKATLHLKVHGAVSSAS